MMVVAGGQGMGVAGGDKVMGTGQGQRGRWGRGMGWLGGMGTGGWGVTG